MWFPPSRREIEQMQQAMLGRLQQIEQTVVEQQRQARAEWTDQMQKLEQTVGQHLEQQRSMSSDLAQWRAEWTGKMEALEHMLARERTQWRTDLAGQLQTVEKRLVQERAQTQERIAPALEALEQTITRQIQQIPAPVDLTPLRTEVANRVKASEQTVVKELHALRLPPQLSQLAQGLEQVQQSLGNLALASQSVLVLTRLANIQEQLDLVSSVVAELSATAPSGASKPIGDLVRARIALAVAAITNLGNEYANWLEQQYQYQQETQQVLAKAQQRVSVSMEHVFPGQEEPASEESSSPEPISPT